MYIVYNKSDIIIALCFDVDVAKKLSHTIDGAYIGRYSEFDKGTVLKLLAEHIDLLEE